MYRLRFHFLPSFAPERNVAFPEVLVQPEVDDWVDDKVDEVEVQPVTTPTKYSNQHARCCRDEKASGDSAEHLGD